MFKPKVKLLRYDSFGNLFELTPGVVQFALKAFWQHEEIIAYDKFLDWRRLITIGIGRREFGIAWEDVSVLQVGKYFKLK